MNNFLNNKIKNKYIEKTLIYSSLFLFFTSSNITYANDINSLTNKLNNLSKINNNYSGISNTSNLLTKKEHKESQDFSLDSIVNFKNMNMKFDILNNTNKNQHIIYPDFIYKINKNIQISIQGNYFDNQNSKILHENYNKKKKHYEKQIVLTIYF